MSVEKLNQSWCQIGPDSTNALVSVNTHLNGPGLDHGEANQYKSALLTILLEHLKEKEPDLYSPTLMRIEARRKGSRHKR